MGRAVAVVGPRAAEDLRAAYDHYRDVGGGLADAFRESFEQLVERLEMFPLSGTPVDGPAPLRRARMRRFPFGAFYRPSSDAGEVRILRVLHERRDHATALAATD